MRHREHQSLGSSSNHRLRDNNGQHHLSRSRWRHPTRWNSLLRRSNRNDGLSLYDTLNSWERSVNSAEGYRIFKLMWSRQDMWHKNPRYSLTYVLGIRQHTWILQVRREGREVVGSNGYVLCIVDILCSFCAFRCRLRQMHAWKGELNEWVWEGDGRAYKIKE